MPFIPNTPESHYINRSDSKNPTSTCAGITNSGRPCRRGISVADVASLSNRGRAVKGNLKHPGLFCWQHRDQATPEVVETGKVRLNGIRERSSVDTLVDRLGLLEVDEKIKVQSGERQKVKKTERRQKKRRGFWFILCGGRDVDVSASTPRPIKTAQQRPEKAPVSSVRPPLARDPSSRELLRLIPKSASPATVSSLLAELTKPITSSDVEGYIYMFWATSAELDTAPVTKAASSLLEPPKRPDAGRRRTSDVLQDYSKQSNGSPKKTILLKIGRASNVQRRLNEWQRQCGYDLSLIRYYPYDPNLNLQRSTPRKVPVAHKVERLIHIELADLRASNRGRCPTCDREHKEWFEVGASRDDVRAIDEVIRRWVDWSLRAF